MGDPSKYGHKNRKPLVMLGVFKRRYRSEQSTIIDQLAMALLKKQRLIAEILNNKVNKLNRKVLLVCFAVYCLCFGATCIYIGIEAFHSKATKVELVNGSKKKKDIEIVRNP